MKDPIPRRTFLQKATIAGVGTALGVQAFAKPTETALKTGLTDIHIFSKHLQFLNYKEMSEAAAEIGFDGVDLTVRPGGHILPENVEEQLPLATAQLNKVDLKPKLMTTAITDANDAFTKKILTSASKEGIACYRLGYYRYPDNLSIPESIANIQQQTRELARLNQELNISGAYQNHAGMHVGASIWEIWQMLQEIDPAYLGCQYDIRHATVEGGKSWNTGLRLINQQINSIVLKDFKWEQSGGKWKLINTPIGEGMVDFRSYFKLLKKYQIKVPISLHLEYDLGGAEHGKTKLTIPQKNVFQSMKKDLNKIKEMWDSIE
ncbi:MAG: sugar phosphate isomerase/epimerase [Cyclobacteriaceae bacterium]